MYIHICIPSEKKRKRKRLAQERKWPRLVLVVAQ